MLILTFLSQGDFDPTKTKVLHLSMNPASLAQKNKVEEMKKLLEDNRRLRERIKILEKKLSDAHDLTLQVEANLNSSVYKDSTELRGTVATSDYIFCLSKLICCMIAYTRVLTAPQSCCRRFFFRN